MTRIQSIGRSSELLQSALKEQQWHLLDNAKERLVCLLLEAVSSRSAEDLNAIRKIFADAHARLVLDENLDLTRSLDKEAIALHVLALVADVSCKLVPVSTETPERSGPEK